MAELRRLAGQDMARRAGRWAPFVRQQEQVRGPLERLTLVPEDPYEKAFRMLDEVAFARRVVEAYGEGGAQVAVQAAARTVQSGAQVDPGFGDLGNAAPARAAAAATARQGLPEAFTVLLQEKYPDRWPKVRRSLLLRVRAQLKQEAIRGAVSYGSVPVLGLHPYQSYLLTEAAGQESELALHTAFGRLRSIFAAPPVFRPAEGLEQIFEQRSRMDMVAGYALYRVLRAEPRLDEAIHQAAIRILKAAALADDVPGNPPSVSQLFFASILDMLETTRDRSKAVNLLYALYVDYQLGVLGLQNRIQPSGARPGQGGGLQGDAAARVRAMLALDDVLGGLELLPPLPPTAQQQAQGPFQPLDPADHLRRLERFHTERIRQAREIRDRILEKIQEYHRADTGRRARIAADIGRLAFGGDAQRPDPRSLVGLVASQEFEAERRYLLWLGVPRSPAGHDAFYRVFGNPYASPPEPGEIASIRADLEQKIWPFLRGMPTHQGPVDPRNLDALSGQYGGLDQMVGRLRTLDEQLQNPNLDAATRARLLAERQDLLARYEAGVRQMQSSDPLARMDRYRLIRSMLDSGRQADGRELTPQQRAVLERERVRLEREMYPTQDEARRRQQELEDALRRGTDLQGRPASPRQVDAMRDELDRMRTVSRGADPGRPVGATSTDTLPPSRPDSTSQGLRPTDLGSGSNALPPSSNDPGFTRPTNQGSTSNPGTVGGTSEPGNPGRPPLGPTSTGTGNEPPPPGAGTEGGLVEPGPADGTGSTVSTGPGDEPGISSTDRPGAPEGGVRETGNGPGPATRTGNDTTAADPAFLEGQVLARLTQWQGQNGANPWSFPPFASAREIQALLDAAIARRTGAGSVPGLTVQDSGLELGTTSQGVITSAHGGPDGGKYKFWLEVKDPSIRQEVVEELQRRYNEKVVEIQTAVVSEYGTGGGTARTEAGDGPDITSRGR